MNQSKYIIRNDDVGYDTDVNNLKRFCEICDKHGFEILQAIVPVGKCLGIDVSWDNKKLEEYAGARPFFLNTELLCFLKDRMDMIGVHGFRHTHIPNEDDIIDGKDILHQVDLFPSYFVTPFNEGDYGEYVHNLMVSAKTESLETCIVKNRLPKDEDVVNNIIYCHSWRFGKLYSWESLDKFLERLKNEQV